MTTPRSRSLATALLTARSLAAALPPSYTINRDTTSVSAVGREPVDIYPVVE
jgi:hypothetical protein